MASKLAVDGDLTATVDQVNGRERAGFVGPATQTMVKHNPALLPNEVLIRSFAARQPLLDDLIERIRQNSQRASAQHYLLVGPRGIGKTTILRMLAIRVRQDPLLSLEWEPVLFAEEEPSICDVKDFFLTVLERLSPSIAEVGRLHSEIAAAALMEPDSAVDLAVERLTALSNSLGRRFLLLVDNLDQVFEQATSGDDLATNRFRSILQHDSHFMLIGTSTAIFDELVDYRRPLYQFFAPLSVRSLDSEQVLELLQRRAAVDENELFLQPSTETLQKVRVIGELTGGNPRLIVALYDVLSGTPSLQAIDALTRLLDEMTPYYKSRFEVLPGQQRKLVDLLVRAGGAASPSNLAGQAGLTANAVATQLKRLGDAGWLRTRRAADRRTIRYVIADHVFRYWYRMRYLSDERKRLAFLVSFYSDLYGVEELKRLHADLLGRLVRESGSHRETDEARQAGRRSQIQTLSARLLAIESSLPGDIGNDAMRRHIMTLVLTGQMDQARLVLEQSLIRHAASCEAIVDDQVSFAYACSNTGYLEEALTHYREAEAVIRQLSAERPTSKRDLNLAFVLGSLGDKLNQLRRYSEAWAELSEAETILRRRAADESGKRNRRLAAVLRDKGTALVGLLRFSEAEQALEESLSLFFGPSRDISLLLVLRCISLVMAQREANVAQGNVETGAIWTRHAVDVIDDVALKYPEQPNLRKLALFDLASELKASAGSKPPEVIIGQLEVYLDSLDRLEESDRQTLAYYYLETSLQANLRDDVFEAILTRVAELRGFVGEITSLFRLARAVQTGRDQDSLKAADEDTRRAVQRLLEWHGEE